LYFRHQKDSVLISDIKKRDIKWYIDLRFVIIHQIWGIYPLGHHHVEIWCLVHLITEKQKQKVYWYFIPRIFEIYLCLSLEGSMSLFYYYFMLFFWLLFNYLSRKLQNLKAMLALRLKNDVRHKNWEREIETSSPNCRLDQLKILFSFVIWIGYTNNIRFLLFV
jgi:hypothetical protein